MPKGPQGQKRKADVIGNAVLVMKIATGAVADGTGAVWLLVGIEGVPAGG